MKSVRWVIALVGLQLALTGCTTVGTGAGQLPPIYPTPQFITHFSGKVVATLVSSDLQRMRCRFHLMVPMRGMPGGGEGECQLTGARTVRAAFTSK